MNKRVVGLAAVVVAILSVSTAFAQCGCGAVETVYTPVYSAPAPQVTYYAPAASYVSYYAPAAPATCCYAPATSYVSYYAPVAQPYATYYAPVVRPYAAYYGVVGSSMYGTPKVYVPGKPVRNILRAVTP
jgi:hypothetical protein